MELLMRYPSLILAALVLLLGSPPAHAAPGGGLRRGTFHWTAFAGLPRAVWSGQVRLKLPDDTGARLQGQRVVDARGRTVLNLGAALPDGALRVATQGSGVRLSTLRALRTAGETLSGIRLPDLTQWYAVHLDPARVPDLPGLLRRLNALPGVEIAFPVADARRIRPPVDIPPATPDFSDEQGYGGPAPDGIDADYAATVPGGRGAGVTVTDIEVNWFLTHEDLDRCLGGLVPGVGQLYGDDPEMFEYHGTSVLGELFAGDNGYGVTGLVPDAFCQVAPQFTTDRGDDMSRAITMTIDHGLEVGDVILLEAQTPGPNYVEGTQDGLVPQEWEPDVFDTVLAATAAGYVIVAAAGNGAEDLDDAVYQGRFDRAQADSGSIIVGAGYSPSEWPPRGPEYYTNWGSRVDLQAWGDAVTTTGYGDRWNGGGDVNQHYTSQFAGTSSASPIVTGAVAALEGALRAAGMSLTPLEVRALLVATGTPQAASSKHIGPLPDLRAALDEVLAECGDGVAAGTEACDDGNTLGGDGCSADCRSDETCGNGIQDALAGEYCDDGNHVDGDGCSADCRSLEVCGNGIVDTAAGEVCDDGNTAAGDGCSSDCRSNETCGNGIVDRARGEECDDGNLVEDDGCSTRCTLPEQSGCDCSSSGGGGPAGLALLIALLALVRVRRRR
jgi:cysteine-rich repeat protein